MMIHSRINLGLDLKWPDNKLCNLQLSWDGRDGYFAGCSPGLKVGEGLHNL
jgi:hypothetical protein